MFVLPPFLNHCNVSSKLKLIINKLNIFKGDIKDFDVIIQWWGENNPRILCANGIEYLIHGEVFEHYLRLSEVLEFMIRQKDDLEVIGSAFLTNSTDILYKSTLSLTVVDHSGTPIGNLEIGLNISGEIIRVLPTSHKNENNKRDGENFRKVIGKSASSRTYSDNKTNILKPPQASYVEKKYGIAASLSRIKLCPPERFKHSSVQKPTSRPLSATLSAQQVKTCRYNVVKPKERNDIKIKPRYGVAAALSKAKTLIPVKFPYKSKRTSNADTNLLQIKNSNLPCETALNKTQTLGKNTEAAQITKLNNFLSEKYQALDNNYRPTDIKINNVSNALPHVMDYLIGREMTPHEERQALHYLRTLSPGSVLVNNLTKRAEEA